MPQPLAQHVRPISSSAVHSRSPRDAHSRAASGCVALRVFATCVDVQIDPGEPHVLGWPTAQHRMAWRYCVSSAGTHFLPPT